MYAEEKTYDDPFAAKTEEVVLGQAEIPAALRRQEEGADRLLATIDELECRLTPMLAQEPPNEPSPGATPRPMLQTSLGEQVETHNMKLFRAIQRANSIIERLGL